MADSRHTSGDTLLSKQVDSVMIRHGVTHVVLSEMSAGQPEFDETALRPQRNNGLCHAAAQDRLLCGLESTKLTRLLC